MSCCEAPHICGYEVQFYHGGRWQSAVVSASYWRAQALVDDSQIPARVVDRNADGKVVYTNAEVAE